MRGPGRTFTIRILIVVLAIGALGIRHLLSLPDGNVHVTFLSVGQGDSALIVTPNGKTMVIDGGPDWSLLQELGSRLPFFSRTIDLLVLSHPNLDHLAAFPELLQRYRVKRVLLSGIVYDLPQYAAMLEGIRRQGSIVTISDTGRTLSLDGVDIDVFWPPASFFGARRANVNDGSIVMRVRCGENSALFTGDMEAASERAVIESSQDIHADILKIAHHGSRTSSSTGFLLAVHPKFAVISVGAGNRYGHPRGEVLLKLATLGIAVHRTDTKGSKEVLWKGPCKP